jgi:hypothetical protein
MARALECPACGEKHRVENLPAAPTFRCERCGQVLKMPTTTGTGGPPPPSRAASATPVAPPPRRRTGTDAASVAAPAQTVVGVSATVAAVDTNGDGEPQSRSERRRATAPAPEPTAKVHWYWRLLAWVVAVPVGLAITALPARALNFIRGNDILNVFVGSGTGRYARLAILTAVWALVTALLVQLFVEGGRALARRRRARAAVA